jgi:prepilin-type N-terminal cleavage/methylation domain-containing protein
MLNNKNWFRLASPGIPAEKNQEGFTLLELTVGISITGILMLVAFGTFILNSATASRLLTESTQRWEVRKTMQVLRDDIQRSVMRNYIPETTGLLSSNRIRFVNMEGATIQYQRQASGAFRRKNGSDNWITLITGVTANPFNYYDDNLNVVADKDLVKFINVTLQVESNDVEIILQDQFYVRN